MATIHQTCDIIHGFPSKLILFPLIILKVSWIRKSDLHVLTTETMTYTSDARFRAVHVEGSPFWNLEISHPVPEDAGIFECQISSQPKIFKQFQLEVSSKVEFMHRE